CASSVTLSPSSTRPSARQASSSVGAAAPAPVSPASTCAWYIRSSASYRRVTTVSPTGWPSIPPLSTTRARASRLVSRLLVILHPSRLVGAAPSLGRARRAPAGGLHLRRRARSE